MKIKWKDVAPENCFFMFLLGILILMLLLGYWIGVDSKPAASGYVCTGAKLTPVEKVQDWVEGTVFDVLGICRCQGCTIDGWDIEYGEGTDGPAGYDGS